MFFNLLFSFFIIALFYFLHQCILSPYLTLLYYKKQGFKFVYFFPVIGLIRLSNAAIEKHNDSEYFLKNLLKNYPGTKGIAVNLFHTVCLMVTDTTAKKDFFVYKQQFYRKNPLVLSFLKNEEINKDEENLFLAEGESWKRIRRIFSKVFNYELILSNVPIIASNAKAIFDKIHDLENFNLVNEFQKITGNIIFESILGKEFIKLKYRDLKAAAAFEKIISEGIFDSLSNPIQLIFGKRIYKILSPSYRQKMERRQDFLQNFIMKYIQQKFDKFKENPKVKSTYLLDSMFKMVLKKERNLTLNEVFSNIIILFSAGTETTGHLLAYTVLLLEKNPSKYLNLMREIEENSTKLDYKNYDTIKNLEYLNSVIKESLRMLNPAGDILYRQANQNHKLGNIFIKKGTNVSMGLIGNFNDPSVFKNPFEFIPERWLKGHKLYDNAEENDSYCYLPFSAGPRNCLGQHLAIIEVKIVLVMFLRRFTFEIKVKRPITWVRKFLIESKDPLIAKLKKN